MISFVDGIFAVALPLLMIERNIDVVTLGLVFAAMPIVFQSERMLFAIISDSWNRKPFFVLSGICCVLSAVVYYLAHAPLEFLCGKITEGTKQGSLWAVNRAFVLEKSREKWKALKTLRTAQKVSIGAGSLFVGLVATKLRYGQIMLLCALIASSAIPISMILKSERKGRPDIMKTLRLLDLRRKGRSFRIFLLLFFAMGTSLGLREGFVIPLYLKTAGYSTEVIGLILGIQIMLSGVFSNVPRGKLDIRKTVFISGVMYTVLLVLLGSASSAFTTRALLVFYGIVEGLLGAGQEGVLAIITDKLSLGADIGLLTLGLHSGITLGLASSGLIISGMGFAILFWISGLIFPIYYIVSFFLLKDIDDQQTCALSHDLLASARRNAIREG